MIRILSLFDGISCGQLAINKLLNGKPYMYYASEVDEAAIKITQHHFPNTIQLGDVRNITKEMIPEGIDMIIGGSPCQNFSFAGRRKGMTTNENIEITTLEQYEQLKAEGFQFVGQSYLFWEFIRLRELFKPKYYLLENVKMNQKWERIINGATGVIPYRFNSSLVSAQNRDRLYWTNIPNITAPEDRNIFLYDIIAGAKGYGKRGVMDYTVNKYIQTATARKDGKSNCLVTKNGSTQKVLLADGTVRSLSITEREILQTLPQGYTDIAGITKSQKVMATGNCWTVDMVSHIFSHIPEKI